MVSASTEAQMRGEATYLADQLIGQMSVDQGNLANYETTGSSCTSANCTAWLTNVANTLPSGTATVTETKPKLQKPSLYRVLILNDDYTPMEFVIYVLERFFQKDREAATRIMLHVHQHGVGVCGVFTYEVAETKVAQVIETARRHQHPLQCTMEKD